MCACKRFFATSSSRELHDPLILGPLRPFCVYLLPASFVWLAVREVDLCDVPKWLCLVAGRCC